jgi:excisionase family DNA binding protein
MGKGQTSSANPATENKESPFERLVGLEELASLLSVSKRTLYYWVTRREVPFAKIGKHIRFSPSEVVKFFKEKSEQTAPCTMDSLLVDKGFRSLTIRKRGLAEPKGVSNANR